MRARAARSRGVARPVATRAAEPLQVVGPAQELAKVGAQARIADQLVDRPERSSISSGEVRGEVR